MSGNSASRPTQTACFSCIMAIMLTTTATVKAMDSQRWICRIRIFQFNETSFCNGARRQLLVRQRHQLFQLGEKLLPAGMGAAESLLLLGAESRLFHAQQGARARRRERKRH